MASFLWISDPTRGERISSISSRAGTYGNVITNIAVGIDSTGTFTWVYAVLIDTSLVTTAFTVLNAFDLHTL